MPARGRRPRDGLVDLSQPQLSFSQAPRGPARPPLQRKEGEATAEQVASATSASLVTLDPGAETLKQWITKQVTLRGFVSRQNIPTERNRALIALYEAALQADADRAIPLARIRQQAMEDEARLFAERREAEQQRIEAAAAARAAALDEAAAQGPQE
eukprot:Hpha_TRINITY_DN15682_c7_g1::TRINITY_DN15682_c7_g1_i1::g.98141::m.98141